MVQGGRRDVEAFGHLREAVAGDLEAEE